MIKNPHQNVATDVQRGSQASPKLLFICDHEHFAEGREGGRKGGVKVNPRRGGRTPNGYHSYHCRQELFTLGDATTYQSHVLWLNIESGNPYNVKVFLTHISV